ncbi:MAG TPA: hypothetical protein VGO81_09145 [Solirubrobacteraceae bacterium]|nr:hypothetical protein [Solirubrobacteraceae bacterium]
MAADISVLVFSGLVLTLVGAMALPAPAFKVKGETAMLIALLISAGLATVLTGAVALLDMPAASAACGVIAWLLVVQCVWLARGAAAQEEWDAEEEEDDGGGGSPGPSTPPESPSPGDGLPVLQSPGGAPTLPAWGPAPAHSFPLAAAPSTAQVIAAPPGAGAPEAPERAHRRRLQPAPRRVRGDHRSIVHVRAAGAHGARRRRASLRLRLLRGCRRLLWPAPPECTPALPSFVAPEHDGRRRAPQRERLDREAGSRSAVL